MSDDIPPTAQQQDNVPTEETGLSEGEIESFGLARFLNSVDYPASKDDIMDYATDHGLGEEILDMLEQLPDTTYNSAADVSQAMGENSEVY